MEVGTRVGSAHIGHLPSADAVRVGDDVAVRRLPENFGEPHDWHDPAHPWRRCFVAYGVSVFGHVAE
jgi:hypothetical protein